MEKIENSVVEPTTIREGRVVGLEKGFRVYGLMSKFDIFHRHRFLKELDGSKFCSNEK